MTIISGASIEKNYIKKHSWSGFKSGVKYSSYLYLGATVASLLISLTVVPIFPFALLALTLLPGLCLELLLLFYLEQQ